MGYYLGIQGVQKGPFPASELLGQGLRPETLVWTEGMTNWERADSVAELASLFQRPVSPPTPQPVPMGQPSYQPNQPAQPNQFLAYETPPPSLTNGMAIASMVLGIVSFPMMIFYCMGIIPAVLAIVFGFIARAKVKRGETVVGGGMAMAGIILGVVHAVLLVFVIALAVAFARSH
jgi:hypothetical protein